MSNTIQTLLIGASIDPAVHAQLATQAGVAAMVRGGTLGSAADRTRMGHALVAHIADIELARAWLREATRLAAQIEARRASDPQYVVSAVDVTSLWRAWGNFWRALNLCPYGWSRFRWRMEDLLGGPRCRTERVLAGLDVSGITEAENDASLPNQLAPDQPRAGGGGIGWIRHVRTDGLPPFYTDRRLGWWEPDGSPEDAPGAWRRATYATIADERDPRFLASLSTRNQGGPGVLGPTSVGRNIFFGRPQDGGASPPGVGGVARGFPENLATMQRLPTGENHRVWIFNDGRTFSQPDSAQLQPASEFFVPALGRGYEIRAGSNVAEMASLGQRGVNLFDESSWETSSRYRETDGPMSLSPTRQIPLNQSEDGAAVFRDASYNARLLRLPYCPVTPPAVWYWEVLTAPVAGLRASPDGPEVSLLAYAQAVGPYALAREVLLNVVGRNSLLMEKSGKNTEAALFSDAAVRANLALERSAEPIEASAREGRMITGVLTATAAGLAAIPTVGTVAGVVVGTAALITQLALDANRERDARSWVYVDVLGRLTPAWEQYAIAENATVLNRILMQPEMQPPGGVRRTADLVASLAEAALGQMAPTQETFVDGAFSDAGGQTQRATRTVVLYGLDPARGARVQTLGATPQDVTLAQQETGAPARWETSGEYGPVWVFGVPADTSALRVLYPDGGWRDLGVRALPEDGSGATPTARTVFLDATPPASGGVQGGGVAVEEPRVVTSTGYPPRTVVLVGLDERARVYAQGDDITATPMLNGDAARWIDTTVAAGPARGWSFGVAADNVRALDIVAADGSRRTVPLPALPANATTVHDRVTVIDLRASGNPDAALYPSRTVVLVGMPSTARVRLQGRDITTTPMLTGDRAQWIASTLQGVSGWAFGVPEGARVLEVVADGGVRVPVTLAPMSATLPLRERVTTVDLRASIPGAAQASAGGGGGVMVGLAAAFAAGAWFLNRKKG